MAYYLGVDPGLTGGAALLGPSGQLVALTALPAAHGHLDAGALADWVRDHVPADSLSAVEMVGAMPGQGVVSMFTFGETVGTILGVLGALGHFPARPRPQEWQKGLGVALPPRPASAAAKAERRAAVKAAALAFVASRWPAAPLVLPRCRKPHDGLVDALCLAEYRRVTSHAIAHPDWLA